MAWKSNNNLRATFLVLGLSMIVIGMLALTATQVLYVKGYNVRVADYIGLSLLVAGALSWCISCFFPLRSTRFKIKDEKEAK